ncbi:unnamed protein product [Vitrella brassicaformis CCMP3155]|uniref:Coenzyme Q-binding protein COQ10 START domain-containing protein n=1 Tax=Vitrella brassicaformis (strain CCMP3155) TaxID=1169540 RepID=A0A0G4EDR3_VITBC|nr:unnamed protein product [Vitrella brassicaformis CCMP3155]|eukprot:CEL93532.1 unnamed protein product [Vitrella brassicaformis CCMP3155]
MCEQRRCFLGLHLPHLPGTDTKPLHHEDRKLVPYSPEQYYDLVVDVENYEKFLPWCQESRLVTEGNPGPARDAHKTATSARFKAELVVGFRLFKERYTSIIDGTRPKLIKVSAADSNIFERLVNIWRFENGPEPQTCWLTFTIEFKFASVFHQQAAGLFLSEVAQAMVHSFDKRASFLYGRSQHISPAITSPSRAPEARPMRLAQRPAEAPRAPAVAPARPVPTPAPPRAVRPPPTPVAAAAGRREPAVLAPGELEAITSLGSQVTSFSFSDWARMLLRIQQLENGQRVNSREAKALRSLVRQQKPEVGIVFVAYDPFFHHPHEGQTSGDSPEEISLVMNLREVLEDAM